MTVSFNNIPANIRVPLFYAEVDNSMANTATADKKSLIIGQAVGGTAESGKPYLISTATQAKTKFGRGSPLSLMVEAYRANDTAGTLWVLPMDVAKGLKAKGKVAFKGIPTESGTIAFYVGPTKVAVTVAKGDGLTAIRDAFIAAINSDKDLPVTAEADALVEDADDVTVTLEAKGAGVYGNDIPLALNRQGAIGGEEKLAGLEITITPMTEGAGDINYEEAFAKVGSETYYYIGIQSNDATALDACKLEMQDSTGRWSYARMQYGHVFTAKRGDAESLVTFGNTRNDQHATVFGIEQGNPNPYWLAVGAILGRAAAYFTNDPARPLQTGVLYGLMSTAIEDKFGFNERNTLLHNGIATMYEQSGNVMIERCITTYQVNSFGDVDNSYLDTTTLFTLAEIIATLKTAITSKYARHKLADDGTKFGPGQAIVTPSVIRSELVAQYAKLETKGIVENAKLFNKYLIVERNADDPCRIDVLLPPDLVNQLRIFALQAQFRLQYSATD